MAGVRRVAGWIVAGVAAGCVAGSAETGEDAAATGVTVTWLSVTNWLLEAGDTRILFDGYVSRIDREIVAEDGTSSRSAPLDDASVRRVRDAVLPEGDLDWILVGHGHWDHAFDTPSWARLTGARVAGARTTCHQLAAFDIDPANCTAVEGGEVLEAGPGVRVRVVRWHHSGDSLDVTGRRLRAPLELRRPPSLDSLGALRPGFLEDYPNGGGARAYLVTVETAAGPLTLFWSNTGNPQAWDAALTPDTAFLREQATDLSNLESAASDRPTREHLADAMREERVDSVDLWIGFGGAEHVQQVVALLRPRTFVPHHWDDFRVPLEDGVGAPFRRSNIEPQLDRAGIRLIAPRNYFDRITVAPDSAALVDGVTVRRTLGVREARQESN